MAVGLDTARQDVLARCVDGAIGTVELFGNGDDSTSDRPATIKAPASSDKLPNCIATATPGVATSSRQIIIIFMFKWVTLLVSGQCPY